MFESKRRALLFMILSICAALIAVILFSNYLQQTKKDLGELASVQVAKKDIPAGMLITPDMVEQENLPKKYMLDSLVQSPDDLKGKISLVPVVKGSVITTAMLRPNTIISGEYRQVILRAPLAVFDDMIDSLDKVDLLVSYDAGPGEASQDKRITKVLLKDVTVNNVFKMKDTQDPKDISAVGVVLKLEDSKSVVWALNYGKEIRVLKSGSAKAQSEASKEVKPELDKKQKSEPSPQPQPQPQQQPAASPAQ